MQSSIRHLRMFQTLAETHSITRTAELCNVSQPAVTQAMTKLERDAGIALLQRTPQGIFLTEAGEVMALRATRALAYLDAAMADMSRAIRLQATRPQLAALIAVTEVENFTIAARQLGLAQPTVHRSTSLLEQSAGIPLFERTAHRLVATRAARQLAQAARLAFTEMAQAEAELAQMAGRDSGRLVIGALPMSQGVLLPMAIRQFRATRPGLAVEVIDGRYSDLSTGLSRGEIDMIFGLQETRTQNGDFQYQNLFDSKVVIVARKDHPLHGTDTVTPEQMAGYPWVIPPVGAPVRKSLEDILPENTLQRAIVTSSETLMRALLRSSDYLAAIPQQQFASATGCEDLSVLPTTVTPAPLSVGLCTRTGWKPTPAQQEFMDLLHQLSAELG